MEDRLALGYLFWMALIVGLILFVAAETVGQVGAPILDTLASLPI